MTAYKLHVRHYIVALSGFAQDQPVWSRGELRVHRGPSVEVTMAFPQDPPLRFNIPYPVTRNMLRSLVARHGGALWPHELKLLHNRIDEFVSEVTARNGWYKPYRTFPDDFEDCVASAWPVTAKARLGSVEADVLVRGWF